MTPTKLTGPEEYTGNVIVKTICRGSKSERIAAVLITSSEQLVLRRQSNQGFVDKALLDLEGKNITCTGRRTDTILIISKWVENDAD